LIFHKNFARFAPGKRGRRHLAVRLAHGAPPDQGHRHNGVQGDGVQGDARSGVEAEHGSPKVAAKFFKIFFILFFFINFQ
jgi:hypothetical protein